ncbi:MAG: hypothetical protein KIT84_43590 [Labilithrix sp.]|nr:hypothetical protein [Labilithrix sp.]MCW5817963.1 hypothetical protein [Labilithrix sp.]
MRRFAWAALALGPLACGLVYAPGDFIGEGEGDVALDAGADRDEIAIPDATPDVVPDATAPDTRIVIVGGHRPPLSGETGAANVAETMRTTLSAEGVLGPWQFDAPPPVAAQWTNARIAGGDLFVHNTSAFARAPFSDRVAGPWSTGAIKAGASGIRPWLLSEHGFLSGATTTALVHNSLRFLDDGGLGDWTPSAAQVAVERTEVTLARTQGLVYVVGGRRTATGATTTAESSVEVGTIDANGALGALRLVNDIGLKKGTGTLYAVYAPIAVAGEGRLFVLGGVPQHPATKLIDRAFVASIVDPATGTLGDWAELPLLPAPMSAFAAVVTSGHLLVFGGSFTGETSTEQVSDAVLDLAIHADGTYGAAWQRIGTLPGPRSGIVAATY